MKNVILVFFIFVISPLLGQERFEDGQMKIGSEIYSVRIHVDDPIIGVSNISKNIRRIPKPQTKGKYEPLPIFENDIYVDTSRARSIIFNVLKDKLSKLKENKDFIAVRYVFDVNGKIMNINYILSQNTIILPRELAKIDQNLRKEMKAYYKGNEYKAFPAIHYNRQKWIYF